MKQRLGIAQALLNRPRLLICDEPTSALDPVGRKEILDILQAVREQTTVVFSTHILSDVERICTDIAFLNEGRIVEQGKLSDIQNKNRVKEYLLETVQEEDAQKLLQTFQNLSMVQKQQLTFKGSEATLFEVLRYVADNKIPIRKVEHLEPTLESLFLEVIKG